MNITDNLKAHHVSLRAWQYFDEIIFIICLTTIIISVM